MIQLAFYFAVVTVTLSYRINKQLLTSHARCNLQANSNEFDDDLGYQGVPFKSGFVTILGNPNVGKSTLMNALLNERLSIVSPKPQTTRHRILGVLTEKNYQLIFSDTPGMLVPAYKLQETMMDSVRGATSDADVVLLLTDVYGEPLADASILAKLQLTERPVIVVINKLDLLRNQTLKQKQQSAADKAKNKDRFAFEGRNTTPLSPKAAFKQRIAEAKLARQKMLSNDINNIETNNEGSSHDSSDDSSKLEPELPHFDDNGLAIPPPVESPLFETKGSAGWRDDKSKEAKEKEKGLRRNRVELSTDPMTLEQLEDMWKGLLPKAEILTISAQNRTGVENLLVRLLHHTQEGPKYFPDDQLTTRDERFFAAEIIREGILGLYSDEVPYSCEVVIESFADKSPKLSVIEANIIVNRSSHKAILIGKGGAMLKELGTVVRGRLESFLDRKIFLSLRVKLDEEWRSSDESLRKYGYIESDFG